MRKNIYLILIFLSVIYQSTPITLAINPDDSSSKNQAFKTVDNYVIHYKMNKNRMTFFPLSQGL
ncbi:MAG: hypothetical protein ACXAC7_09725 [Candidatus Hodarchaeales archaeon]|jgi:hypothetical protein